MRYARLSPLWFGFAFGLVWAVGLFFMALTAKLTGYAAAMVQGIGTVYWGYDASVSGGFIGMLIGFVDVGVAFALAAWIYNLCLTQSQSVD